MEGVRILAENAVYDTVYSWGFDPILPGCVILLIFFTISLAVLCKIGNRTLALFSFFGVVLTCGVIADISSTANETEVFSHTEYKVIIEDNVEFKEFIDHYEILDQEGEIYTVREKGDINE